MIKYLLLKKKTNDEIKAKLRKFYGSSPLSLSTIKYCKVEFKRSNSSFFYEKHLLFPFEFTNEMTQKIHDIFINDWRVKVDQIAKTVINECEFNIFKIS